MEITQHLENWVTGYDSPGTRALYRRIGTEWLAWCAARGTNPLKADRVVANAWKTVPSKRRIRPSPSTAALRLTAVSSFYLYLQQERVLEVNPFVFVRRPVRDPDHSDTRGLTREEAMVLLDATVATPNAHAMVCLMMLEGLRVSEVVAADVDDIHLDRGAPMLTVTRKGGKRQAVPLGPWTAAAVTAAIGERRGGPIVAKARGGRYSYDGMFALLRRWVTRAGIADPTTVSPHSCRHTFITLALDSGAALRDVQDAAGHSDPRTTRRYDRSRGAVERHPTAMLEEFLTGHDEPAAAADIPLGAQNAPDPSPNRGGGSDAK